MKNNTTLIFDGNYFIYSRLYVLPKPKKIVGLPDEKFMANPKDKEMLMRKLAIDFASEYRKLKSISNRIVFTLDHRSWRKDFFPTSEYKSNRKTDEKFDWNGISEIISDFENILKNYGVIINKLPGAEGDDLIFAWSVYLNFMGENCIIWSGDKDLIQLVNYNKNSNSFTLFYDNTRSKLYGYPGIKNWLRQEISNKNIDIFSKNTSEYNDNRYKNEINEFINKNKLDLNEIYCDEFVFIKILTGDKSDNIKSVVEKPSKNNNKTFKISTKKARNILDKFKKRHNRFSSLYLFEDEYKNEIVKLAANEMKVIGKSDEILSRLELNTNLILLHVNIIPEAIQKSMFKQVLNDYNSNVVLNSQNLENKDLMLKNTKYLKDSVKDLPKGGVGGLF